MFIYNNTVHCSTGQAPSYLLFGWHPCLSLDVTLGTQSEPAKPQTNWVKLHHSRLKLVHRQAAEKLENARQHQKMSHNKRPMSTPLLPRERVLLRQRGTKSGGKLSDVWESVPYVIVKQPNLDLQVFVVKPETGQGSEKVLHQNLMRPCPVNYNPIGQQTPRITWWEERQPSVEWGFIPVLGRSHPRGPLPPLLQPSRGQMSREPPAARQSGQEDGSQILQNAQRRPEAREEDVRALHRSQRTTQGLRPARSKN